jgi:hypothetical protein
MKYFEIKCGKQFGNEGHCLGASSSFFIRDNFHLPITALSKFVVKIMEIIQILFRTYLLSFLNIHNKLNHSSSIYGFIHLSVINENNYFLSSPGQRPCEF